MSWLRTDDGLSEQAEVMALSDRAYRLHFSALGFCARNLTDGVLVDRSVKVVCVLVAATKKHVGELVAAGLWVPLADGGFEVRISRDLSFLVANPPAEKVKEERAKARDRMRRVRSPERSGERSPTPDPDPDLTPEPLVDQALTFQHPEQTRGREAVAALVDSSLSSGPPDAALAAMLGGSASRGIDVILELLPAHEIAKNTRAVFEAKFAGLPSHFIDLAREEFLAADDVRSPVKYLNGIVDRMGRDYRARLTPEQQRAQWVDENFDHPDAEVEINGWPVDAIERQGLHERAEQLRDADNAATAAESEAA